MATQTVNVVVDEEVLREAAKAAERQRTDISTLISNFISAVAAGIDTVDKSKLPPVTRRVYGMFKGLPNRPYKELLTEALMEKYGFED